MFAAPILGATSPTGAGTRKTYPASTMRTLPRLLFPALTAFVGASLSAAPEPFVTTAPIVQIWPGVAPGSEGKTAPERWVEGSRPDAMHRVTDDADTPARLANSSRVGLGRSFGVPVRSLAVTA